MPVDVTVAAAERLTHKVSTGILHWFTFVAAATHTLRSNLTQLYNCMHQTVPAKELIQILNVNRVSQQHCPSPLILYTEARQHSQLHLHAMQKSTNRPSVKITTCNAQAHPCTRHIISRCEKGWHSVRISRRPCFWHHYDPKIRAAILNTRCIAVYASGSAVHDLRARISRRRCFWHHYDHKICAASNMQFSAHTQCTSHHRAG